MPRPLSKSRELAPGTVVYTGPIRKPGLARSMGDLKTMELRYYAALSSDAGGLIDDVISNNPSSGSGWSSFAGIYGEYRVLGVRLDFKPSDRYSKVTSLTTPGFVVIDNESSSSLASTAAATGYYTAKFISLDDPWSLEMRMGETDQADFLPTASPSSTQWAKFYLDGMSASKSYGGILVTLLVQFKTLV